MVERAVWMSTMGRRWGLVMVCLAVLAGLGLLGAMTVIRRWRRWRTPSGLALFISGLCLNYLLMPLLHHLGFTDGYYYISDKDNFFSRNALLQATAWAATGAVAWVVTRRRLSRE
jgi:hypothetical protein